MKRRGFLAALLAPFLSRLVPKREPTVFELIEAKFLNASSEMTKMFASNIYSHGHSSTSEFYEFGWTGFKSGGEVRPS